MAEPKCSVCSSRLPAKEMLRWGLRWVCPLCIDTVKANVARANREAAQRASQRHERRVEGKERSKVAKRGNGSASTDVKRRVRNRDGHHCRWCGVTHDLEVHHVIYRSHFGPDWPSNLVTLCQTHHKTAHGNKNRWQPVLLALIWIHYVEGRYMTVPEVQRRLQKEGLIP